MGRQSRLVLLLLLSIGVYQITLASTPRPLKVIHDDVADNELTSGEDLTLNTIDKSMPEASKVAATSSSTTTAAPSSKKPPMHEDLKSNALNPKTLPQESKKTNEKVKAVNATTAGATASKSEENYDEYDYDDDYNYNYNYDENSSTEAAVKAKDEASEKNKAETKAKKIEMKPITEHAKKLNTKPATAGKTTDAKKTKPLSLDDDIYYDNDDDEDDDDEDDADDSDNDIADEEEILFNENVPCPRFCTCARNVNSYLVATCNRLDPGLQKFGLDITDIVVTDVGPKYPILLGENFFLQLGLKHISSIKISNCTIEYVHKEAFNGLEELYAVNLTNVGLSIINPDTFAKNKKLRMLTLAGNDLSAMSSVHYLIKSATIEELDLSRNNLLELNPTAFSQLSNIVYINLSQNDLKEIPAQVFDAVETIEELDLSYNELKELPANVFNRTALAILHLKSNKFTGDLHFGNSDLQQLDLSFNSIQSVHHGMFDKMTGLTNLNLKGNGITRIQPDSFLTLKNLRHIDLSFNDLDQISSMVFFKNSELDVIRLNDNPRLSQLPTDGFRSYNGYFTVYYFDISSCAIGALGYKTFSTMPHLATLKLAWNNINNLEPKTFEILTKLIDLDLSNNLIHKLDDLLFINNNDLTKLNLAGNPIQKLSVRLFAQMSKLRELDVSDCELKSLLVDNAYDVKRTYEFYETLRSFNASANQIENISFNDIKKFKNLRTLDITKNPLMCNKDFQDFIRNVVLKTSILPNKVPTLAELKEDDATLLERETPQLWAHVARSVCEHHNTPEAERKKIELEERLEEAEKKSMEDIKNLESIIEHKKFMNILQDSHKSEAHAMLEDELNNGGEANDEEEEDSSDYEEDDENDDTDPEPEEDTDTDADDEEDDANTMNDKKDMIKDLGVKIENVDLSKETKDSYLLDKLLPIGEQNDDDSFDEEIIIDRGRIYYSGYRFLIPIALVLICVIVVLLALAKIVSVMVHKRGERYRLALMAQKSSIVYQKLTEDIKPTKEPKQPKIHRYAPLNQV